MLKLDVFSSGLGGPERENAFNPDRLADRSAPEVQPAAGNPLHLHLHSGQHN